MSAPTDPDSLRERIANQFSYRGERADVWRAFDRFLETESFLNLGYSKRYQPLPVGSSQRRLALKVGQTLAAHLRTTEGVRLLDVGCGRGGPTIEVADRFGFRAVGVDLVPYNVSRARENATERRLGSPGRDVDVDFVVGDATRLPLAPRSVTACTAVDALVYLPDREAVFAELAAVLDHDGLFVCSDLLALSDPDETERRTVDRFADAWDMPPIGTRPAYERALADAGFDVRAVEDLTPHSVGRFRKWTWAFLQFYDSPAGAVLDRLLERRGFDVETVLEQVRRAHDALPSLRHALFVARLDAT